MSFAHDFDTFKELILKGQSEEAIVKINKDIQKYPNDPTIKFIRGAIFDYFGKTKEAKEDFLFLSNKYPKNPILKNNLGVVSAKLGDYSNARICFESALRLKPDYQEAKDNLIAIQRKYSILLTSK